LIPVKDDRPAKSEAETLKIGINTYPFLWTSSMDEAFPRIKNLGFTQVEILASPPFFPLSERERIKPDDFMRIVEKAGVNIHSLNLPGQDINLASPYEEMRVFTENQYRKLIDFARKTGVPYIVMPPGRLHPLLPPDFEWIWRVTKPHIERLVEYAEKNGVTMLVENVPTLFLQTAEQIDWATGEIKSRHFAVAYDVANAFMVEDPAEGIRKLGAKIRLIHLSDTTRSKWEHNVIGSGAVDFGTVNKALLEIGFDGICMLEIIAPQAENGILSSIDKLRREGWTVERD